jgi:DNA-binding response OmpR family regulator
MRADGALLRAAASEAQMQMDKHVLIADDDAAIRDVVAQTLSEEGYHVEAVADGQAALDYLERCGADQPDVILLDMLMPALHGRDFAAAYRRLAVDHAPIVAMTATRDAHDRAAEIGAAGIVAKPFAIGDLIATVDRLTRRRAVAGS